MSTSIAFAPHAGAAFPPPGTLRRDGLTAAQRRWAVVAILGVHGAVLWALLQVEAVRDAVRESAPMFVDWIAAPAPAVVPVTPVMPVLPTPQPPRVVPRKIEAATPRSKPLPSPPAPLVTATPSLSSAPGAEPAAPALPAAAEPVAGPAPALAAVPSPAPPAAPQQIPPSAVQYLVEPAPEYPRLSARAGETGRVMVRVLIDAGGLPREVQVGRSSGFPRLDAAALAAVQKARFRPPTLNGQPVFGWANVPIDFGLEK